MFHRYGEVERKIVFRDRPLKEGETSHYHCNDCGQDIHPDFVHKHKCEPLL